MKIMPLYIPLKQLTGQTYVQHIPTKKARKYLKYNDYLDEGFKGRHSFKLTRYDNDYKASQDKIEQAIEQRITKLVERFPDKIGELQMEKCKLLVSLYSICRAYLTRNASQREAGFYHLNTAWLRMHRIAYGDEVTYFNHCHVACTDHFIPESERFYGRRKR